MLRSRRDFDVGSLKQLATDTLATSVITRKGQRPGKAVLGTTFPKLSTMRLRETYFSNRYTSKLLLI